MPPSSASGRLKICATFPAGRASLPMSDAKGILDIPPLSAYLVLGRAKQTD